MGCEADSYNKNYIRFGERLAQLTEFEGGVIVEGLNSTCGLPNQMVLSPDGKQVVLIGQGHVLIGEQGSRVWMHYNTMLIGNNGSSQVELRLENQVGSDGGTQVRALFEATLARIMSFTA